MTFARSKSTYVAEVYATHLGNWVIMVEVVHETTRNVQVNVFIWIQFALQEVNMSSLVLKMLHDQFLYGEMVQDFVFWLSS